MKIPFTRVHFGQRLLGGLLLAAGATATLNPFCFALGQPATEQEVAARYELAVTRALRFLRDSQSSDGSFSSQTGPAVTALVATAALRTGRTVNDPLAANALEYIEKFVQPDGGIYRPNSLYRNYETCLSIVALQLANDDGRYDATLEKAERFVKDLQYDEQEGHDETSTSYGGAGYGRHKRPDLSNTSFLVEALVALGNGPDDENLQKALHFVSQCQNHESGHNLAPFAVKNPDGGFYYTAAAGGQSQAEPTPDMAPGALRSYGSMTYAGLKSMIYAGLGPDDERVKAATEWLAKNYDLTTNPGMGDAGLYYYYHTVAKALAAIGADHFVDDSGARNDWRRQLINELAQRQSANGSWANENPRWLEGDPNLVTAYSLLALSYCKPAMN